MHRTSPQAVSPDASRTQHRRLVACVLGALVALTSPFILSVGAAGAATAPVGLGSATSFAVLAGAGITNTGPTTITGDVGTFATTSEVGFNTVTLLGVDHAGDAVTQQAKTDLVTAYNQAAASGPPVNVADELGGSTLTPGVYNGAALQITGTLTLDTLGDPNAVFVFQTGSTLITASASNVIVLGGGTACNVYWQVPSSATLGTASNLIGTVMASTSISADTGATIQGRLLASTGAVTLDSNTITRPVCAPTAATTTTTPAEATTATAPPTAAPQTTAPSAFPASGFGAPGRTTTTNPGDSSSQGSTPPELAFSGSSNQSISLVGGLFVATGAAMIMLRRRRVVARHGGPGAR